MKYNMSGHTERQTILWKHKQENCKNSEWK